MALPLLRTALAVLFISSFAFALNAEDVARFYLKSGESMKLEPVTAQGHTYNILKIDGKPSLVLAPSGTTFEALTKREDLDPVVREYAQQVYKSKDFKKSAAHINESLLLLETVLGNCDRGGAIFTKNFPRRTIRLGKANVGLKYIIDNTQAYKNEKDAYVAFNTSYPAYHEAYQSFISRAKTFGDLVSQGNYDSVLEAASVIRDSTNELKKRFEEVSTAYRTLSSSKELGGILNFAFYDDGEPLKCFPNSNSTTSLSRIENEFSDQSIKPPALLLSAIEAFSAERGTIANQGTAHALREEQFKTAEIRVANISTQFIGQGYTVELKSLTTKKESLKQSLAAIKANGSTTVFDSDLTKLDAEIAKYQEALAPFKNASAYVKRASENVTQTKKKYGETDNRVQALNTELNDLKANMTTFVALLSSGDAPKASSAFSALTLKAADLAQRAGALPPKGNELEMPVIGGILALVLVLAGTVWYFRKMKQQQPKLGTD